MVVVRSALAVAVLLALSGCAVTPEEVNALADQGSAIIDQHNAGGPAFVAATFSNLTSNVTGLTVVLAIAATGSDGMTYAAAFGDNSSANGTLARALDGNVTPANKTLYGAVVNHTYEAAGTYNITVTILSGNQSVNQTLPVTVTSADAFGPTQEPMQFEGSVVCLPTLVFDGELAGESQPFTVNPGQRGFTFTMTYDEILVEDLDFVLKSPSGKEFASEESGPEPPLVVPTPEAGEWAATIIGYSCMGELSYTLDIIFD